MLKKIIYIIITLTLFTSLANAWGTKRTKKVVLLPVEQTNIPASSKLSNKQLSNAMEVQLTRLKNFQLAEFAQLSTALDDKIIDDAVFELLVTDDLKETLAKLDCLETRRPLLAEYCKVGQGQKIDYLVDVSIEQDSTQLRLTYYIIDTKTAKIALAKSFYDVPNDPTGVGDEIAKRLIRSLWKLEHNK